MSDNTSSSTGADTPALPDMEPVALATPAKGASRDGVWLNDDIEIFPSVKMAAYDQGPIKAYSARTRAGVKCIAYLCEHHLISRAHSTGSYAGVGSANLARLVGAGIIDWPADGRQHYTFVYEGGWGQPLLAADARPAAGMKPDVLLGSLLRGLIAGVRDLRNADFPHGGIRPSNIFDCGNSNYQKILIGDCLTAPFSYSQPALYLTPAKMLASPASRGLGTPDDDVYALGVTLAVLMRAADPHEGYTTEALLKEKLELGTYAALLGKDRTTGAIHELLRGTMNDDVAQRWTIDEVADWLEGRRLNPKQPSKRAKANRPIVFQGNKYLSPYILGVDLPGNVPDAIRLVEGHEIKQWLNRSVGDKLMEQRYDSILQTDGDSIRSQEGQDSFVYRIALSLNSDLPVLHKGLKVVPDGIGTGLAEVFAQGRDLRPYVDLLSSRQVMFWLDMHAEGGAIDTASLIGKLDHCQAFLKQKAVGYGIERCVYVLCPEAPCFSEKLKKYYVRNAEDLIHAYEDMAKTKNRPIGFFDRHIVAFLLTHDKQTIDAHITDLNSAEPHRQVIATLQVMNNIQTRYKMPPFPKVSEWLLEYIQPVFERIHDREMRKVVREKAAKAASTGKVQMLLSIFENPHLMIDDFKGFRDAMQDYLTLQKEYDTLDRELETNAHFGMEAGRQFSAILCGLIAMLIVIGVSLSGFGGGASPLDKVFLQ